MKSMPWVLRTTVASLVLGATLGLAEPATPAAPKKCKCQTDKKSEPEAMVAGYLCPLYPLINNGDGTALFYCDDYEESCDASVQAGYVTASEDLPWPYQQCDHIECVTYSARSSEFTGLCRRVMPNYMHVDEFPKACGAFRGTDERLVKVHRERNNHFLQVKVSDTQTINAKLVEFKVFRLPIDTHSTGKWLSRFVAFEIEGEIPNGGHKEVIGGSDLKQLDNEFAYSGQFIFKPTEKRPALILLHNPKLTGECPKPCPEE